MINYIASALPPKIAAELRNSVLVTPLNEPYTTLKTELVKRTSESELCHLRQLLTSEELGDCKPPQLLRQLQQPLGERAASFDTLLLKERFL